ncbi:MAG: xanthine dehydrogenase family protein molybdopterin-binding subunit [Anaerolineaceae bacterium]
MENIIGKSIPRFDAYDKVTGYAKYPSDFNLPNQLFLKTIFSPFPHASIESVDTSDAESVQGVIAILTASDVPCNEYGLLTNDQPVLCGRASNKPYAERVRFIGDKVAFIIAENEESAQQSAKLIDIHYTKLPVLSDLQQARDERTIIVHPEFDTNLCSHFQVRKGNVEKAFNRADVIIEDDYSTPVQEHAFLQPEAGLAFMDEKGVIHIITAGQWTHGDQRQIAHALQLPEEKVQVEYTAIGGAFGGKEDISVQIALGLAAYRLAQMGIRRPVKTIWGREESFFGHHKRHAFQIHAKWGALRSGKIIAAEMRLVADAGAYASSTEVVLQSATIAAIGPYEISNVFVDADAYYTNNIPSGAFRGFGVPQACFAVEMQVNKLADALHMDPVAFRLQNVMQKNSLSLNQTPLPPGIGITDVIEKCAASVGLGKIAQESQNSYSKEHKLSGRYSYGMGFAAGFKSFGIPPDECWAKVEILGDQKIKQVKIYQAASDMGQGVHSILKQFVADIVHFPFEKIEIIASSTITSCNSGSASASRMTYMAGHAVQEAARAAMLEWEKEERPAVGEVVYHAPATTELDALTGEGYPNFGFGYAAEAVEVRVDHETGTIEVLNVVCVDDVGKAINPQQVHGQIEGCIVQALGYTLIEEIIQKEGNLLTKNFSTYLIPTIKDIPRSMESIIMEIPDPNGPNGAKGMGEIPYGPFAPALCAAVHVATGVWFNSLPLKQEKVIYNLLNKINTGNIK